MNVERLLDEFLSSGFRNQWLETKAIRVYVRKSHRVYVDHLEPSALPYDDNIIPFRGPNCLDIATVEVSQKFRGKGIWRDFIRYAESVNPFQYIMVESVGNADLREMLTKNGYSLDKESFGLNYYKKNNKS